MMKLVDRILELLQQVRSRLRRDESEQSGDSLTFPKNVTPGVLHIISWCTPKACSDETNHIQETNDIQALPPSQGHHSDIVLGNRESDLCQEIIATETDVAFDKALNDLTSPNRVAALVLVSNENIHCVPVAIGRLESVTELYLCDNFIEDLPWSIVYLKKLKILDLSSNMLTVLPRTIGYLSNLLVLNLRANYISHLPSELLKLNKLERLDMTDNIRLVSPPLSVCKNGVEATMAAIEGRQGRCDLWKQSKPWVGTEAESVLHHTPTLMDIAIETILACKIDFLQNPGVPPVMKQGLQELEREHNERLQLAKCSVCGGFYSTKAMFDNHTCRR